MKMTALRDSKPGDATRAKIAHGRQWRKNTRLPHRTEMSFRIFAARCSAEAVLHQLQVRRGGSSRIHPERPTSLLYEKDGDGYKLSLMYRPQRCRKTTE